MAFSQSYASTKLGIEFYVLLNDQLADNSINGAVVNFSQTNPTSYSISFNAAEEVGDWSASRASRIFRAEPNTFEFMCVDYDKAYAPTENWTSSDGSACMCNTNYTTTCQ